MPQVEVVTKWPTANLGVCVDACVMFLATQNALVVTQVCFLVSHIWQLDPMPPQEWTMTKNAGIPFPHSTERIRHSVCHTSSAEPYVSLSRSRRAESGEHFLAAATLRGGFHLFRTVPGAQPRVLDDDHAPTRPLKKRRLDENPARFLFSHRPVEGAESGWCGVAVCSDGDFLAVARYFSRDLRFFRGGRIVSRLEMPENPSQVRIFGEGERLVAVAAGSRVRIFDLRMNPHAEKAAIVENPLLFRLYEVSFGGDCMAIAGEDRLIPFFDTRRWDSVLGRWKSLRHFVHHVHLSTRLGTRSQYFAYATGSNELKCGQPMCKSRRNRGSGLPRGGGGIFFDDDIVGVDLWVDDADSMVVVTKKGTMYSLRHGYHTI